MRLVADVGGTNCRLALARDGRLLPGSLKVYRNVEWDSLDHAIRDYLDTRDQEPIFEMVIAIAGPVQGERAHLTNWHWRIETSALKRKFDVPRAYLLNDLTALGHSVPGLKAQQLREVRAGEPPERDVSQSLVVGIGTGFNLSPVFQRGGATMVAAVEAGHVGLGMAVSQGLGAAGVSPTRFPTVEHLFSGRGFTSFCRQLTGNDRLRGDEVMELYGSSAAEDLTRAIDIYAGLLGWHLRDLLLGYQPYAGVYFAGSVARAVMTHAAAATLEVVDRPDDLRRGVEVPFWVIEDDGAALNGCAQFEIA